MVAMPIVEIINGPSVTKTSVSTGWTMDMPVVRARPLTPANAAWKTFSGTRHHANNSRTGWVQFALPPRGPPLPHHRSPCFRARGCVCRPSEARVSALASPRGSVSHHLRARAASVCSGIVDPQWGPHASARLRKGSAISRPGPASA